MADPNSRCAAWPSDVSLPSKLPTITWPMRRSTTRKVPSPSGVLTGPLAFSRKLTSPPHRQARRLQFLKILQRQRRAHEVSGNGLVLGAVTSRSGDNPRAAPIFLSGWQESQLRIRHAYLIRRDIPLPAQTIEGESIDCAIGE